MIFLFRSPVKIPLEAGRQAARVHASCNKLYNFIVITGYVEPSYYYVKRLNVIIPHDVIVDCKPTLNWAPLKSHLYFAY